MFEQYVYCLPLIHRFTLFRAAQSENFEALIKMGVACLYGEGGWALLNWHDLFDLWVLVEASAPLAGNYLIQSELMNYQHKPFTWLLFRPPWSSQTCSKACIFQGMKSVVDSNASNRGLGNLAFSVAKVYQLSVSTLVLAAKSGC